MAEIYIYWISTALLSLLYLISAATYVVKRSWVRQTILGFGYPDYLVPILIVVKLLAVAVLLSRVSVGLSDLAYAGMLYHLLLSALAHVGVRKPAAALPALLGLTLLGASFLTQNAARQTLSPYVHAWATHQITLAEWR
ncbi:MULTISPECIES: DoxX family protein [Rhizobium]|uniref:DoxX family protein n=1 Tax=Rhizobium phaseoli TaxID=396 RepID=UPI0007E97ECD|nr:DoxX family protein [Rhizobium phaseoli]ANL33149.1 DoxX family protein [Rhizobium phaseoli]ANL96879.1 DoxX family protein [Rhizobium phaseoli]